MEVANVSIGVVIVTYNSGALIDGCLDALIGSAGDIALDIVVVDNNSTDDVVERARQHSSRPTVVAGDKNAGYAAGINVGISLLQDATAVLVLNPDCRLHVDALGRLNRALADSGSSIVGPRIHEADGSLSWSIFREPTVLRAFGAAILGDERAGRQNRLGEQETRPTVYNADQHVAWMSGAALLISRKCIDDVGPWDETFFLYSEETDFQMRAARLGHLAFFVASAVTTHDGGDSPVSPRLWSILTLNRVRLYRKFHGPLSTMVFGFWVTVGESLRAVRGRGPSRSAVVALLSPKRRRDLFSDGRI